MKTTLLIDGDILCYMAASSVEERFRWDEETTSRIVGDPREAEVTLVDAIEGLHARLGVADGIVCLSCPTVEGWRSKLLPSYKAHRNPADKPVLLGHIKDYVRRNYAVKEIPTLEADDVMGILSTHPKLVPGRKIIVSIDKDMQTIPGWLFNPGKDDAPRKVSVEEADYWHLYQTLVGDAVDGYKGCPGIGPVKATKILEGKPEWSSVVTAYEAKGLTERDALVQARVARICRASEYYFKTKEVRLWIPRC